MLKKYLSFLKRKPQKEKQKPRSDYITSSPNLLTDDSYLESANVQQKNFITFLKFIIFFTSLIFGVMLMINSYLDTRLNILKDDMDVLVSRVEEYSEENKMAREIDRKVTLYREIVGERLLYKDKISSMYEYIDEPIVVWELDIRSNGFTLVSVGPNPLVFAQLIHNYLENDVVSELIIRSASLRAADRSYIVKLEGKFK